MKLKRIAVIFFFSFFALSSSVLHASVELKDIDKEYLRYDPVFMKAVMPYFENNVFDPDEVNVTVVLVKPSGEKEYLPAFCRKNNRRRGSVWEARFTPVRPGGYEYFFSVRSERVNERSERITFEVGSGPGDGFLRKSADNNNYLVFDSGRSFYGIGYNVPWVDGSDPRLFREHFSRMSENGINLSRVWMCDWSFPLEWDQLGHYDSYEADKLDEVVEIAAEKGIYMFLCLDNYGSLMEGRGRWDEARWRDNPYNADRGGPCEEPRDFFTDPEARRFYRNRLRYIIARWGYSPNIIAFELWNEYNAPLKWTEEMAAFIKEIDISGRFVTTSLGYPSDGCFDSSLIWSSDEMDLVTMHDYGTGEIPDLVSMIIMKGRNKSEKYSKPYILSEFGINCGEDDVHYDPGGKGLALHNSLWASLLSGSFGSAMNWWHDTYIDSKGLYRRYNALEGFTSEVDFSAGKMRFLKTSQLFKRKTTAQGDRDTDVVFHLDDDWGDLSVNEFVVEANGDLSGLGRPVKYLHGFQNEEIRSEHVYRVNYPEDGKFIIRVGEVSQDAFLHVFIDEDNVLSKHFPAGPGEGPWKDSEYIRKYDLYRSVYDKDLVLDVPEGESSITLINTGDDWMTIDSVRLVNYLDDNIANARVSGLIIGEDVVLWIQNRESNWKNVYKNRTLEPIKNSYFHVYDLEDGEYDLYWWDTFNGWRVRMERNESKNGKMTVQVPEFKRDMALQMRKVGKE